MNFWSGLFESAPFCINMEAKWKNLHLKKITIFAC